MSHFIHLALFRYDFFGWNSFCIHLVVDRSDKPPASFSVVKNNILLTECAWILNALRNSRSESSVEEITQSDTDKWRTSIGTENTRSCFFGQINEKILDKHLRKDIRTSKNLFGIFVTQLYFTSTYWHVPHVQTTKNNFKPEYLNTSWIA